MTLCSANASFHEKLASAKKSPDGESVRLLEYKIEPNDVIGVARGKDMFDHQLNANYGHAGEVYLSWLVNNLEEAKALVLKIQARLDKEIQFTSRERYWSATAACNIAGGIIAQNLGLHDFDMKRVYAWLKQMLAEMRHEIKPAQDSPATSLGEFINSHINNALVVNGEVDARSNLGALPLLEPRGELLIRYEPDTKHLYVAAKQFKDFCVKQQINYRNMLKQLAEHKIYIETTNKRMSKGMKVVAPAVRALMFDAANSEFLRMDDMLPANENRDSSVSA
jgi:hypothetical protein